jgi:uncharacterized membrane protein
MPDLTLSSIGLLLAAVLSVCNVFTDVARKKVVDRHELVASTFWIRVFAALVFTVALLVRAFNGSPPVVHAPAGLSASDLKDLPGFAAKLKQPMDAVSQLLADRLSETSRQMLAKYTGANADAAPLLASLVKDLNGTNVIKGELIHDDRRFAGVTLSAETQKLLGQKPSSEALAYLNRLLVEDAFPQEITKNRRCALFGYAGFVVSPLVAFLIYLAIDVAFIACAQLLLMRALQISPMSLCIPFMAFTPVFLIGTGYVVLGELPSGIKLLGVGLIVIGSLVMHRRLFATGWTAPLQAIVKEKGSRYILLVAFILAITNPIEKQLILMSDPMTPAFAYGVGLAVFFGVLAWARHADCGVVMRKTPHWAILAGVLDAAALLLQYFTITYLAIVITISIKRAGIVLAILAGWLIFKEREITDKLIAASVMVGGVVIFYLPLSAPQAFLVAGLVLVGMTIALYATHPRTPQAPRTA